MKESKFIELLNLYIDQQISPDDAALLEEEILRNPRRRQIYGEYCRMHRACTMVLERNQARNGMEQKVGRVVAFEAPHRFRWGHYAAGLAAAACVALVAVQTVFRSGGRGSAHAVMTAEHAPRPAKPESMPAAAPAGMDAPGAHIMPATEGYFAQQLRFALPMNAAPCSQFLAAPDPEDSRFTFLLPPANTLRATLRPSIEDFVFADNPATPNNPRIVRPRQQGDGQAGNMALEFQR